MQGKLRIPFVYRPWRFLGQLVRPAFCARSSVCESREIESNVDLKIFVPCERAAARRHLGLGEHERIVLFNPGRDPALEDPQLAAAAVAEAREYFSDVRSVVLEPAAPAEEIAVYMNAADVLLVTSKTEGSGAVVHEAMACNLPVVSVDVGDVRERLEGVAHCAVMSRDPVALGAALAEVLRAPQRSDGRVHVAVAAARGWS
jgi:glycosyltransferase involved in cell wall biosynthesis